MKRKGRKRLYLLKQLLKRLPKKRHLHGGILHKIVGDRLFDKRLWVLDPKSVAAGVAVGTIIAFTPTFPLQMLMAGSIAFFFKINLPAALIACWITNPLTMPIIYPLEYKIGKIVSEAVHLPEFAKFQKSLENAESISRRMDLPKAHGFFTNTMPHVKYIFVGSTIFTLIFAPLHYFLVYYLLSKWQSRGGIIARHIHRWNNEEESFDPKIVEQDEKRPPEKTGT